MRLEEAQAAFDRANNRELRMKELIEQFRAQYATAVQEFKKLVSAYVKHQHIARAGPVDPLPSPLHYVQLNGFDTFADAVMKPQISGSHVPAFTAEYTLTQAEYLRIAASIARKVARLKEFMPQVQRLNSTIGGCWDEDGQVITISRIRAALRDICFDFPHSVRCNLDTNPIRAESEPAASPIITDAAKWMAAKLCDTELAEATALLAAVTKREAGPAAYAAGIELDASVSEYVGGYPLSLSLPKLPPYIGEMLRTRDSQVFPAEEERYLLRALWQRFSDSMFLIQKPDSDLVHWIKRNTRPGDPWPADVCKLPGLWTVRCALRIIAETPGCKKAMFDMAKLYGDVAPVEEAVPVVSAEQLRNTAATMLHMYEVLIDRVYGTPKRRADDGDEDVARSPKRAACSD
jgi:hypothetical protein